MRKVAEALRVSLLVAVALAPVVARAAAPLAAGEIVVAGSSYEPELPGACPDRICRVDPMTGAVTPISDALPSSAIVGDPVDLAVESATEVLVLFSRPVAGNDVGTVMRLDVTSGALSTLASGFDVTTAGAAEMVVTETGRLFVNGRFNVGILEIDATSGAVSTFAPGSWRTLAIEPSGTLLTTRYSHCDPDLCYEEFYEFVRIDPATGTITPLGELIRWAPTNLLAAPNGDRIVFMDTTGSQDSIAYRWTPVGQFGLFVDDGFNGMALDLTGNLIVGGYDYFLTGIPEIQRWDTDPPQVLASFNQDFGVAAVDVAPPACRDGIDNDGDGDIDHPADIGCRTSASNNENPKCDDGLDNDGDGAIDWDGGGATAPDGGCQGTAWRNSEASGTCGIGAELVLMLAILRLGMNRARA